MTLSTEAENCPMMRFVYIFSGKWVLPIMYHLIHADAPIRFGQLQKVLTPITQKELSKQLRLLEHHSLIIKTAYPEIPPKVEYQISHLGKTMQPALQGLSEWMLYFEKQHQNENSQ